MKTDLFDSGIQTEKSDIRAHVSVVNQTIYVFPTQAGLDAVNKHAPPLRTAGQPGVDGPTAEGWLVRPEWIRGLRKLHFISWPYWNEFTEELSTGIKGQLAVDVVLECLRGGRFPIWIDADEASGKEIQLQGVDILLFCNKRIQVKCDYRAGPPPGTGNLFLQKAERNPLKIY
jgi:hypothetical protein